MNNHSCALLRAANLQALDYPFDAALFSALTICDEAVVVVGQSQDDTLAWVGNLAAEYRGRVKIVKDTIRFDLGWQERWWQLAASHTQADWLLWLDADEVIDPRHADHLHSLMAMPISPQLIRFPFVHLYATINYEMHFPLTHNTRLGRRSAGFRMRNWRPHYPGGAACQMVMRDQNGNEVNAHNRVAPLLHEMDFPILHYGWCRDPMALALSQRKQRAWYADGDGLEDGRLVNVPPFDYELGKQLTMGAAERWDGEHPAIMQRWFEEHAEDWRELETETKTA